MSNAPQFTSTLDIGGVETHDNVPAPLTASR